MRTRELTTEQEVEADRIAAELRPVVEDEVRRMSRLLAGCRTEELFGATEFELRDGCHRIGASALQTALSGKKRGIKVRASAYRAPTRPPVS
jgi:hypothetical protein